VGLALVGLWALLASFVNPFGWRALWQPFEFFFHWRHEPIFRDIVELRPIDWSQNWRNGLPLVMLGWPLLMLWRARRSGLDRVELLLCACFTALTLVGQRFVGFYVLVAAPYLARDLDARIASVRRAAAVPLQARAALASLACLGVGLPEWTNPLHPLGVRLDLRSYPVAACDFMAARGVRGVCFNQYEVAGYLLYRFWPEKDRLPFIDIHQSGSRTDRYLYAFAYKNPRAWRELSGRYAFDYALLDRGVIEGNRLLDYLDADSAWALVFVDDAAALFVRRNGRLGRLAEQGAYDWVPAGAARLDERMRRMVDEPALRSRFGQELRRSMASSPYHSQAQSVVANLALMEGRLDQAARELRGALAANPWIDRAHQRLGLIALAQGRPREALREFAAERRRNGDAPGLAFRTGQAYGRLGDRKRAVEWYRRELKRDPGNPAARDSLEALMGGG
jgi:tetratricopeptide (TPR) repeat protein